MFCLAAATVEAAPPVLTAVPAPALDVATAWHDRGAWDGAPPAVLRAVGGVDGAPAEVRARWNAAGLFFEFFCRDAAIVAPGREDGLDHFRLGDVVEIFLGRTGAEDYAEVHATPAGRQSRYFFRGYRRLRPAPAAADGIAVRAGKVRGGWRAVMVVPWEALGVAGPADDWEFLAGRYDYAVAGGTPVLSSFPVQTDRPDFHARERYARLVLRR